MKRKSSPKKVVEKYETTPKIMRKSLPEPEQNNKSAVNSETPVRQKFSFSKKVKKTFSNKAKKNKMIGKKLENGREIDGEKGKRESPKMTKTTPKSTPLNTNTTSLFYLFLMVFNGFFWFFLKSYQVDCLFQLIHHVVQEVVER